MTSTQRTAALLLPALLSGCTEVAAFLPTVSFDRLEVKELSWTDISTDFVFEVTNPNPVKVGVAQFDYAFDLEGINLLSGDNADGFELAADGTSQLELPIDLVFAETWELIGATKGEDLVDFQVAGQFGFDTPIGRVKIPYDESGGFPALRTPTFRFDKLRVSQVDLFGATLALDLGVTNEHASELFFDDFAYAVELEGFEVGSGVVSTFDVSGASEGIVSIPLQISFFQVGAAVVEAIVDGGPVKVGLGAAVDIDTPFGVIPLSVDETGNVAIPAP